MNYKELQQIAKEVGAVIDVLMLGRHDNTVFTTGELERFTAIIEKRTIERCAVPEHAINSIKEACEEAMHYTVAARIPECGNFGRIAQNLSFALQEIAAIRKLGEQ